MFTNAIALLTLLVLVKSGKILIVVPTPSISHQVVFRPLIQGLINRNHEVTVITTDPVYTQGGAPSNLKEIDIHDLSYTLFVKWFQEIENIDPDDFFSKLKVAYRLLSEIFEDQLKEKSVNDLIKNQTSSFDLLILESLVTPTLIFSHFFKAPVIQMSSFGANPGDMEMIGAMTHPFVYPSQYHRRIYNLTIFEKINELYKHVWIDRMVANQQIEDDRMLRRLFGNDISPLSEMKKNVQMLFLNVHPIWLHNQPVPPNVVYTWGIHKIPEQPLPADLQSYLDSSKRGAIYISLGTNFNTSSLTEEFLGTLLKVFSRVPYNILWKWDLDELPGKSKNIKIAKWFPQSDILRHPNLKLFITQGGLQSTDEAIIGGVPLIAIPMIADQEYNAEKYVYFKIGIKLGFKTLSVEGLENAIDTIFTDYDRICPTVVTYKSNVYKSVTLFWLPSSFQKSTVVCFDMFRWQCWRGSFWYCFGRQPFGMIVTIYSHVVLLLIYRQYPIKEMRSYQKNIIQLRTQMQDLPKPPLENAIWWIEYIMRHGGARHLRTPAANMSWTEYYELELIFMLLSGLLVLVTLLVLVVYATYEFISRMRNLQTSKTKIL